jgi:hypothetical protein
VAGIYLDPMIIGIAVTIVVVVIGIFEFLPQRRESESKKTEKII